MMDDDISEEKRRIVHKAQQIADEELSGESRYTSVTLWDDGDFFVEVFHGLGGWAREKIVYRSSESGLYSGEKFIYVLESVDTSATSTTLERRDVTE